ncbi:MAG: DEAD/DEAH box helicase [Candidatus Latescibacterota bacterium]
MSTPPSPGPEPTSPAEVVSVRDFLAYLEERVLGQAVVHRQTIPARPARLAADLSDFPPALRRVLQAAGVTAPYTHQAEGMRHLLAGRHLAMATPTASGKTLVYNGPVLAHMLEEPEAHALYVFPLKALEQDQLDEVRTLVGRLGGGLTVDVYDGDTSSWRRTRIRAHPPNVLITTPDMLHAGLLAFHEAWAGFFARLRFVVVDELHTYTGVFGSHVLHLFRRLNRVCSHHGSSPVYVASSATIGNPAELAGRLANRPFTAVVDSGAPAAARHFAFLNPAESPNTLAATLLRQGVLRGLRTIVFTRARVVTELIYNWATQRRPELQRVISSYRAGYLPEERRQIEAALLTGELLGVVSTSALELGIDIGGLDVCVLVGYPGSIVNTYQRAGRVGRAGRESLILLVASRDALDQYFMRHPERFFGRGVEEAVVDPANPYILKHHLACAAREVPLGMQDPEYPLDGCRTVLDEMVREGDLLQSADGAAWHCARKQPHRLVNLRAVGEAWTIRQEDGREAIGSVSGGQVYSECHDGAVYLHRGRQYLITGRDASHATILARQADVPYYTRSRSEKETRILGEQQSRPMAACVAHLGRLQVSTRVVGFEQVRAGDQAVIARYPLESPVQRFETVGFWLELDERCRQEIHEHGFHPMGSIHALEHALKSLFPLVALCNRTDVGGISHVLHPQLGGGAVFVYDYHPGGIGLAEKGYEVLDRLLRMSLEMVSACDCEGGCPSCIHFPTCGSGNVPLDKAGCIRLLETLTGQRALPQQAAALLAGAEGGTATSSPMPAPRTDSGAEAAAQTEAASAPAPAPEPSGPLPRIVVFDLETQRSAAEVGGWANAHLMRVSVAVAWDSQTEEYTTYFEKDVARLLAHLQSADLVVGFNVLRFDYAVLSGYEAIRGGQRPAATHTGFDFGRLRTLDILAEIYAYLHYRVSLDSLAWATLGRRKTADGLQALQWWKEGRLDLLEAYCRHDVEVTRDLFLHGLEEGHLLFDRRDEGRMRVPLSWQLRQLAAWDTRGQQGTSGTEPCAP